MPIASTPRGPAPRNRILELAVEQAAAAVARARQRHGDAAVRERVERAISAEDAATTARVLRILAHELGDEPVDLDALDARLRLFGASPTAAAGARAGSAGAESASASESASESESESASSSSDASASGMDAADPRARPGRPRGGLRSTMIPRRR